MHRARFLQISSKNLIIHKARLLQISSKNLMNLTVHTPQSFHCQNFHCQILRFPLSVSSVVPHTVHRIAQNRSCTWFNNWLYRRPNSHLSTWLYIWFSTWLSINNCCLDRLWFIIRTGVLSTARWPEVWESFVAAPVRFSHHGDMILARQLYPISAIGSNSLDPKLGSTVVNGADSLQPEQYEQYMDCDQNY